MDELTKEAVKDSGVSGRNVLRSKNFFALGLMAWLFHRPTEPTIEWVEKKFARLPEVAEANKSRLSRRDTRSGLRPRPPRTRLR